MNDYAKLSKNNFASVKHQVSVIGKEPFITSLINRMKLPKHKQNYVDLSPMQFEMIKKEVSKL